MSRPGTTRITADVPTEDVDRLTDMANRLKSTKTTALVRAIRTSDLLEKAAKDGARIEIIDKDGTRRQVLLP